ncbi:MAG: LysR family transcriptional regulator [Proteobacteria bacterium]|nr:MAG: LysR family transcriptional regulator [Pseudomonadota bacterium]
MDKGQLDGLLALKLVAEKKSFIAAANLLRVSSPAVSKMIKHLEHRLGATLLTRTTRATSLTEAGQQFLEQAGPALDTILLAMNQVGIASGKPSGRLRLNVPTMLYPNFLKERVRSFVKKYPEVSVEVCFENAASDIFERGFDAGIRLSDILAKDMVALKLFGPIKFVVTASPAYLNKAGRPKHPKDLLSHDCIVVGQGARIYDSWEFESKGKAFDVQVKPSIITNDSIIALDMIQTGAGMAYTTEDAIRDKLNAGKLETVLDSYAPTSSGYYLYFPQRSQVQPKLRAFIEHLQDTRNR